MNIHEHQAKDLLRRYGVAVPDGQACFTVDEAVAAAERLGFPCVVKAQIHAGGRGKAGGVKLVRDAAAARTAAAELLGKALVTHQTGPQGRVVRRLLVEQGCAIAREMYLGMVVDRQSGRVTAMASTEGGVEIEEVAARAPEKILREAIDPAVGFAAYQGRRLAFGLGSRRSRSVRRSASCRRSRAASSSRTARSRRSIHWWCCSRRSSSRSTPRSASTTTPSSATPTSASCAIPRRKTRARARPPSTTSPTSRSRATSAAW